jgi:hypothetical protein
MTSAEASSYHIKSEMEARTPERSDGREAEPVDACRSLQFQHVFAK